LQFNNVHFQVYIGAVNELAVLSDSELLPLHSVSTGPVRDSPLCSVDGSSCLKDAVLRDTDNHNKVLQVLPDAVLQCGSVRQGTCSFHSLRNLSLTSSGDVPVAAISPTASCVSLKLSSQLLAIAVSHRGGFPYRDQFQLLPALSFRAFLYEMQRSLEGEAAVFLRAELRSSFAVRYINIFPLRALRFHCCHTTPGNQTEQICAQVAKLLRFCDNDTR
ncbi:hypothetical protein COOONC_19017, partial [Cooperia oncophora]